jgi:ribosomal-protein-alanine N-acetyltransferase
MLRLRLAKSAEAQKIAELSRDLVEAGLGWTWHPQRVLRSIRARETNVVVATDEDRIAGFAIMDYGETRAHLTLLAVTPTHRRQGIGTKLLAWHEEAALAAGIEAVELELRASNHAARRFYQRLGFVEFALVRGYYQGVEAAVRMVRDIRRSARTIKSEPL